MSKVHFVTSLCLLVHLSSFITDRVSCGPSWPLSFMPLAFQSHPTASIWPFSPHASSLHHHHHHHAHRTPLTAPFLRPIPLPEVQLAFPLAHSPSHQLMHSLPLDTPPHEETPRHLSRARNEARIRKQKLAIEKLTQAAVEKLEGENNVADEQEIRESSSRAAAKRDHQRIAHHSLPPPSEFTTDRKNDIKYNETSSDPYRSQASQVQATARRYNSLFHSDLDSSSIDGKEFVPDARYIETMPPDPPKKPLDIKRKTIPMPNGQVTYITEMLYDIEDPDSGHSKGTRAPTVAQFLPPSSDDVFPPTENPAQINTHSASSIPPSTTVVSFTMPVTALPSASSLAHSSDRRSTESSASLPTPPTPYRMTTGRSTYRSSTPNFATRRESSTISTITTRSHRSEAPSLPRHADEETPQSRRYNVTRSYNSNSGTSSTGARRVRMRSESIDRKTWATESDGLGAAAIAGIVIGSLVSITLLAGELDSL